MSAIELEPSPQAGQPADFTLPAVEHEGTVSLADYRGKSALLLGLFRGLYCPMCRRRIAQMALARDRFRAPGVETLGVVGTNLEHARVYFRFHPTRLQLAADPTMSAARAFRVPKPRVTPELLQSCQSTRVDPDGELAQPVPITEIAATLNALDGYEVNEADLDDNKRQWRWDLAISSWDDS
jgi:peroxiredoxin